MPVYMIRAGDNGPVKIGYSKYFAEERLAQMQSHHYEMLQVMRILPGDYRTERAVHLRFADNRIRGEWFSWCPEMMTEVLSELPTMPVIHQEIIDKLIDGGVTMADVAREYKISRERVRQIAALQGHTGESLATMALMNHGLTEARKQARVDRGVSKRRHQDERLARVLKMDDEGHSQVEIAKALGIAATLVSQLLVRSGRRTIVKKKSPEGAHGVRKKVTKTYRGRPTARSLQASRTDSLPQEPR